MRSRAARVVGVCVVVLGLVASASRASAQSSSYHFTRIASLGDAAPGGGLFINDFEPGAINNRGDVAFVADLTLPSEGDEGVFLGGRGGLSQLVRAGVTAPGGGVFSFLELGRVALNDQGDATFAFALEPFTLPIGNNSGVYLFPHDGSGRAIVVPGVTRSPTGGVFSGTFFDSSINNEGEVVFTGMISTSIGPGASIGLGMGAFLANDDGEITTIAAPGDPAPGGTVFDFVIHPWVNDVGDVAFDAHVAADECIRLNQTLPFFIFCASSVYVRREETGQIISVAHQGEPAPGGGIYRLAFGTVMNNRGDLVFIGDLTPPPNAGDRLAVFLHTRRGTMPIARPGDPMPGGGRMVRAPFNVTNFHINNPGTVVFAATLDSDDNGDGILDTGLYVWTRGALGLVARTGTTIPGIGTVAHLQPPVAVGSRVPHPGAVINDRGEILFQVTLSDRRGVLLVATP